MMSEVLEVTSFKLAGFSAAQFVEANDEINDYLRRQPVHTMIDQRTVDWWLAPVLQQIVRDA